MTITTEMNRNTRNRLSILLSRERYQEAAELLRNEANWNEQVIGIFIEGYRFSRIPPCRTRLQHERSRRANIFALGTFASCALILMPCFFLMCVVHKCRAGISEYVLFGLQAVTMIPLTVYLLSASDCFRVARKVKKIRHKDGACVPAVHYRVQHMTPIGWINCKDTSGKVLRFGSENEALEWMHARIRDLNSPYEPQQHHDGAKKGLGRR